MQVNNRNVVNFMDFEKDARSDIGYSKPEKVESHTRPSLDWAPNVLKKDTRSPKESPLKEWWLEQEAKKAALQAAKNLP